MLYGDMLTIWAGDQPADHPLNKWRRSSYPRVLTLSGSCQPGIAETKKNENSINLVQVAPVHAAHHDAGIV